MLRPTDGIYGLQASLLKTLASPRRLEIVHFLGENGPVEVRKLADHFGSTQPAISQHLAALRGVGIVGINANDAKNYPADSPARMKDEVKSAGYIFPYLYDESQAVAKSYRAACTPDIFLFDRGRRLVYRGQFDASRPGNGIPVTGKDLRAALEAVLAGKSTSEFQVASIGCNIKWKSGNEPDYF